MKHIIFTTTMVISIFLIGCGNNKSSRIADYGNTTDSIYKKIGSLSFDTLKDNNVVFDIVEGNNSLYIYELTGVYNDDYMNYESKYEEVLLIEIDTAIHNFKFCDKAIDSINCVYLWKGYGKEAKFYNKKINAGCIEVNDSMIKINVKTNHKFGSKGGNVTFNSKR